MISDGPSSAPASPPADGAATPRPETLTYDQLERELEADDAPRGLAPALVVALLVAIGYLVGPTIGRNTRPGPDEMVYFQSAQQIAQHGLAGFRSLASGFVSDSSRWIYPPPIRVGYLTVAALWLGIDGAELASLAHLSLANLMLTLLVAFRIVAPRLGEPRALFATLLLGASPLWLGLARRALQDSFVTLALTVALWTFVRAVERPESRLRLALFAAALAFAILSKESSLLLVPPLALWVLLDRETRPKWLRFAVAIAAALAASALVWIVAAGGFEPVWRTFGILAGVAARNDYAIRYGSGPWYRYLIDLVALSAGPTLLGVGGLALVTLRAREGKAERLTLLLALVGVATIVEYAFLTKNLRYVMLVELPLRLLAVEALWLLFATRRETPRVIATAAVVALFVVLDYGSFRALFLDGGLYDPVSAPILTLRHLVPG